MQESDCDRSQSLISGASWDGNKRGRRSSFRGSRVAAAGSGGGGGAKAYSPRWMDQDGQQRRMAAAAASSDGYGSGSLGPDDSAVVSFSVVEGRGEMAPSLSSSPSHEHASAMAPSSCPHDALGHSNNNDSASQASQAGSAHDSHDEGYLSHSTAEGYQSGGYHSYHPALSYAPSVKSDIATGE